MSGQKRGPKENRKYENTSKKQIIKREKREEKTMTKRGVVKAIILTFATLGIYGIYWFVKLTNETNNLAPEEATMSGGAAFLVTLLTFGVYGLYWSYKLGRKMDIISGNDRNTGIIYLVLSFLGLGIVAKALAQNELNCRIERQDNGFAAAA